MDVGFVGLGAMGLPMVGHLLRAGHRVTVSSRSPGPVGRAVSMGAVDGRDPAGVVAAAEVTVICVPSSADVEAVVDAAWPALGPGRLLVDASTIDPDVERGLHARVAAAGAAYLEAPMSGGTAGAEAGTLTLMVGGDAAALERARPVLECFAARIVHVGGPGSGQVVKLANNVVFAAQMLATAEAVVMAERAGIDLHLLHEVLSHSTGDCVAVRTRFPVPGVVPDSPASNDWRPGFAAELMAKDLDLAVAWAARRRTPLFSAGAVRQLLGAAVEAGDGRRDFSVLAKVVRGLAGL